MNPRIAIGGLLLVAVAALVARRSGGLSMGYPGTETSDLSDLAPSFRARWDRVAADLRNQGFLPEVLRTARSPERQAFYLSKGWSQVSRSYHTVQRNGRPASYSVDVGASGLSYAHPADIPELARFYIALRAAARRQGLSTGGEWRQTSATWAAFGLGWDPGHVQPTGSTIAGVHNGAEPTYAG